MSVTISDLLFIPFVVINIIDVLSILIDGNVVLAMRDCFRAARSIGSRRCAVLASNSDVTIRVARGLVRLAEPLLIMAAFLQLRSSRRKCHAVALSPIKRHSALQRPL